jgi:hypothetical protein
MQSMIGKDGVGLTAQDVQSLILATIGQLLDSPDLIAGGPGGAGATPTAIPPVEAPQGPPEPAPEGGGAMPPAAPPMDAPPAPEDEPPPV